MANQLVPGTVRQEDGSVAVYLLREGEEIPTCSSQPDRDYLPPTGQRLRRMGAAAMPFQPLDVARHDGGTADVVVRLAPEDWTPATDSATTIHYLLAGGIWALVSYGGTLGTENDPADCAVDFAVVGPAIAASRVLVNHPVSGAMFWAYGAIAVDLSALAESMTVYFGLSATATPGTLEYVLPVTATLYAGGSWEIVETGPDGTAQLAATGAAADLGAASVEVFGGSEYPLWLAITFTGAGVTIVEVGGPPE